MDIPNPQSREPLQADVATEPAMYSCNITGTTLPELFNHIPIESNHELAAALVQKEAKILKACPLKVGLTVPSMLQPNRYLYNI